MLDIQNHSNLSGFQSLNLSLMMQSNDDPDEKFLLSGADLPVPQQMLPILQGAKFLERLWRGNIPFMLLWVVNLDARNTHQVCHKIYQPHIDRWQEILESEDALFFVSNRLALEVLPINPYAEPIDSADTLKWRNDYNFHLYVYGAEVEALEDEN